MSTLDQKARQLNKLIFVLNNALQGQQAKCWTSMSEITGQEIFALQVLREDGSVIMSRLAERLELAANSATSLVDKLERKKLARRKRREDDRRVIEVVIRSKGRQIIDEYIESKVEFCKEMLVRLNEEDQNHLLRLTAKIMGTSE